MSLSELRGQLRELRKSSASIPISKMRKTDIVLELEKYKPAKKVEQLETVQEEIVHEKPVKVVKKAVKEPVKKAEPKTEKPVKIKKQVEKSESTPEQKVSIKSVPRKKVQKTE